MSSLLMSAIRRSGTLHFWQTISNPNVLRKSSDPVVPYPLCKNVSEDWVHSMMGVHQMPNRISAAEKAPSMIW